MHQKHPLPNVALATLDCWVVSKPSEVGNTEREVDLEVGFEIEFDSNAEGKVDTVTLQLNDTWKSIMQRVLDRRAD